MTTAPSEAVVEAIPELRLHPLLVDVTAEAVSGDGQWVARSALSAVGLPAPVRVLLDRLPD
mgnify:CR=1 FL=1